MKPLQHAFVWCSCIYFFTGASYAQKIPKEEVSVEWDFSRRSPINPAPFAKRAINEEKQTQSLEKIKEDQDLVVKNWTVQFGDVTVRRMLQRWADDAGYQLLWDIPRDFPIEVEMTITNQFRGAVSTIAESLSITDFPIQVSINPDTRLLRVIRYLNSQAR